MHDDLQVVAGAQNVVPGVSGRVRLADRLLQTAYHVQHLASDVDECMVGRIAYAEMITPSTRVWGEAIISGMSLQVPGSDSSALTTRYFGFGLSCGMKLHFIPVGKPARRGRVGRSP